MNSTSRINAFLALHSHFIRCVVDMVKMEKSAGKPISIFNALHTTDDSSRESVVSQEVSQRMAAIRPCIRAQVESQIYNREPRHTACLLVTRDQYTQRTAAEHWFANQQPFVQVPTQEWRRLLRGSPMTSTRLATNPASLDGTGGAGPDQRGCASLRSSRGHWEPMPSQVDTV